MRRRRYQDQNMKELVRRSPDIERAGGKSFGYPAGIKTRSDDIQEALSEDVRKTDRSVHLRNTEKENSV